MRVPMRPRLVCRKVDNRRWEHKDARKPKTRVRRGGVREL